MKTRPPAWAADYAERQAAKALQHERDLNALGLRALGIQAAKKG